MQVAYTRKMYTARSRDEPLTPGALSHLAAVLTRMRDRTRSKTVPARRTSVTSRESRVANSPVSIGPRHEWRDAGRLNRASEARQKTQSRLRPRARERASLLRFFVGRSDYEWYALCWKIHSPLPTSSDAIVSIGLGNAQYEATECPPRCTAHM